MRQVRYKKRHSLQKKRKVISICESTEEQKYKTYVRKNFIYVVNSAKKVKDKVDPPEIHIVKHFDTKSKEEKFQFRVKGSFYIVQNEHIFKVNFRHSLNIKISWKAKYFSPKKSVILT